MIPLPVSLQSKKQNDHKRDERNDQRILNASQRKGGPLWVEAPAPPTMAMITRPDPIFYLRTQVLYGKGKNGGKHNGHEEIGEGDGYDCRQTTSDESIPK